jgi:tRNA (mo5U34)-methyltransferase
MAMKRMLGRRARGGPKPELSPELTAELDSQVPWMYPWDLGDHRTTPIGSNELAEIHATRRDMIEPYVREALAAAPDATVLDLGCNEGWFGHVALAWGARRVVGIDIRERNVRRADLVRDHLGIPPDRLRFERASVYNLTPERLGTFDVVLVLGLIYHLEDPFGALRRARALTRGLAVIESQLTTYDEPIVYGWGQAGVYNEAPGHWAAVVEPAAEQEEDGNLLSSFGGVVSLVPNRAALLEAVTATGFRDAQLLEAGPHLNRQYVDGDRAIVVGRA